MTQPDVSIILITYNDAKRLGRAIASAQKQTLKNIEIIVVDDASTDETPTVLAGITDPRVRHIRLERNSGGCSAPRNAGLDMAQGTWVMFGDSDDELESHAAKNLVIAAEQSDADMACGVAERVDVKTGKAKRWRSEHHAPGVIEDITERPGLIFDTICVNKIYRRSWLGDRRFVENLLYEDQLFTLQCYLAARRIAIIDPTVYYWFVEKLSESITQRRGESRNIESRIAINQLMDAELAERRDIRKLKDYKFLAHEVYLYLRTIERLDDGSARDLLAPLVAYVKTLDLTAAEQLRPALRVALYYLLLDDLTGVRRAMRNIAWAAVVDTPVITRDGRDYWGSPELESGPAIGGLPAEWWLDITGLRASSAPFPQQRPCHRIDSISGAWVSGTTVDALGNGDQVRDMSLVWVAPGDRVLQRTALQWTLRDGVFHWRGACSVPDVRGRSGHLAIDMQRNASVNRTPVRWEGELPDRMYAGEFGTVRWRDEREPYTIPQRFRRRLAGRLPPIPAVVFDRDDWIRSASLSALLAESAPEVRQYWVRNPGAPESPPTAQAIDRGSALHRRLLPQKIDPPLAVVAAHLARINASKLRTALDIRGPVIAYLPAGEPVADWLEQAELVQAQILVHRLDGHPVHVPAAMRAWVTDARGMSLAAILALADRCVTDAPEMAVYLRSLGFPVAQQVAAEFPPKEPLPDKAVRDGEYARDRIIESLRK